MGFTERFIKLTKENEKEVLRVLEGLGCVWCGGIDKPTEWIPSEQVKRGIDWDREIIRIDRDKMIVRNISAKTEITLEELKGFLPKPRVVRTLKDLDGLVSENKVITCMFNKDTFNGKPVLDLYDTRHAEDAGWWHVLSINELNKYNLNKLSLLGIEVEYKPLRTKEEVIKDMERLACEKSDNCKTMVFWDKTDKDYVATDDVRSPMNIKAYFTDDMANDFVAELREILKETKGEE